jgi:hypothetical protein
MLVDGSSWERGPEDTPPPRMRLPHVPWRPFAFTALLLWLLVLAGQIGGFAGYGLILVVVFLGAKGLDRLASRWDWGHAGDSGAWR